MNSTTSLGICFESLKRNNRWNRYNLQKIGSPRIINLFHSNFFVSVEKRSNLLGVHSDCPILPPQYRINSGQYIFMNSFFKNWNAYYFEYLVIRDYEVYERYVGFKTKRTVSKSVTRTPETSFKQILLHELNNYFSDLLFGFWKMSRNCTGHS